MILRKEIRTHKPKIWRKEKYEDEIQLEEVALTQIAMTARSVALLQVRRHHAPLYPNKCLLWIKLHI